MGDIYFAQNDFNSAKDFYLSAFDLSKKNLFLIDLHRIVCIKSLVDFYSKQNMKEQAIGFCSKQLTYYEQYLTKDHVNIAYLLMIMAELYENNEDQRIICLEKASKILEKNLHLHYDTTANCFKLIGQYYEKKHLNEKGITFYMKTLEIQKKIYPENHLVLKETQYLIDMIDIYK